MPDQAYSTVTQGLSPVASIVSQGLSSQPLSPAAPVGNPSTPVVTINIWSRLKSAPLNVLEGTQKIEKYLGIRACVARSAMIGKRCHRAALQRM